MANNNEQILSNIISYISGQATEEEKAAVENWLQENDENKKVFAEVADIWDASSLKNDVHTNAEVRFQKLQSRIKRQRTVWNAIHPVLKYAAVFVFAVMLGGLITYFLDVNQMVTDKNGNTAIITAPLGSKAKTLLPDGTEVWLNAGSTISYSENFTGKRQRQVSLNGEAFFKVTENKEKPFAVIAEEVVVRALGTSFNVKAYADEPTIEATLVEGKIAISHQTIEDDEIILKPNEQVKITKEDFLVSRSIQKQEEKEKEASRKPDYKNALEKKDIIVRTDVKTELYTSWKNNRWIIENEQLGSLAKKLERRYAVTIKFRNESIKNMRFSGTLTEESLEQVLEVISFASPVTYKVEGANVYFDSN